MILNYLNTDSFQMIFEKPKHLKMSLEENMYSKKRATNGKYITFQFPTPYALKNYSQICEEYNSYNS